MTKQRPLPNWLRRLASWMIISEFRTTSTTYMIKEINIQYGVQHSTKKKNKLYKIMYKNKH